MRRSNTDQKRNFLKICGLLFRRHIVNSNICKLCRVSHRNRKISSNPFDSIISLRKKQKTSWFQYKYQLNEKKLKGFTFLIMTVNEGKHFSAQNPKRSKSNSCFWLLLIEFRINDTTQELRGGSLFSNHHFWT